MNDDLDIMEQGNDYGADIEGFIAGALLQATNELTADDLDLLGMHFTDIKTKKEA